jgi:hypothetical protein
VAYWGGYLWVIDDDGDVHRGASYTSALSSFYTGGDALILMPMNDRMFLATDSGEILRLDSGNSQFDSYHDPAATLNPIYLTPFRQYMTVVNKGDDDQINIFRLPDYAAHGLHQLGHVPSPAHFSDHGCPVMLFQDEIYMLTYQQRQPGDLYDIDVYAFNGHETKRVARLTGRPAFPSPSAVGLLVWHDKLLFYDLDTTGASGHDVLALVGDRFVDFAPTGDIGGNGQITPWIGSLGDYLVCTHYAGGDGVYYAHRKTLQDGYLETAYLDMHQPGREKRLEQITVLLDGEAASFKVNVKYRVDDATGWTTALSGADDTRTVRATAIGVPFYLLQVRVELDDDTGNNEDIGIEAISVLYSADQR